MIDKTVVKSQVTAQRVGMDMPVTKLPLLIVGVGVPGSGKTTVLRQLAVSRGMAYVCPDEIRGLLTGNVSDQSRNEEVWQRAGEATAAALKRGTDVVFDATNTQVEGRINLVKKLRQGAGRPIEVEAWVFEVPLEECVRRNAARERVVPVEVLERKYEELSAHPVSEADGFDRVIRA